MLSDFYRTKEWRELIQIIRLERAQEEGVPICAYCGKPIVKAYDCIGHHIEPLTEENVYDASISLNPDNIMLVHHRCHNKIHDRLGLSYTKQVFLVYGAPLSGKTSYVTKVMRAGDMVVDMDSIWQCVSGQDRYVKPQRLKQNVFAMRDFMIDMIRTHRGNWLNAYVIGGYPLVSERERLIRSLGAREIYIDTPKSDCLQRVESDNRPSEYVDYIEDWFERAAAPPL